VIGITNKDHSL